MKIIIRNKIRFYIINMLFLNINTFIYIIYFIKNKNLTIRFSNRRIIY